jgi:nuclease HARBI1
MNQLLMTLRFYALGSMLIAVGDFIGVHKSTACRIVYRVTDAIARLAPDYIMFPNTEEEIAKTHIGFFRIARFPRVIGAIDCTHIKIQSPGKIINTIANINITHCQTIPSTS